MDRIHIQDLPHLCHKMESGQKWLFRLLQVQHLLFWSYRNKMYWSYLQHRHLWRPAVREHSGFAAHKDTASERITHLPVLNTFDPMIPSLVFIDSQDSKTGINEGALHVLNLLADLKANDKLSRKCSELNVTHLLELIMSSGKFHFYKIGANIFCRDSKQSSK